MNTYKSNKQLKNLSIMQMNGHMGLLIGSTLLQQVITFFASFLISSMIPTYTYIGIIINYIVVFIVQILAFVLQAGLYLIYMNTACRIQCTTSTLFDGFRIHTNKIIKIAAILASINSVCNIPAEVMFTEIMAIPVNDINTFDELTAYNNALTLYIIVSLGCALLYFLLTLSFIPAFYMIWDYPDDDIVTILKRSISVMKGNRIRYLLLQLSFIPSILLSFFTCCISLLWVIPLMNIASTNFYLDIMAVRNKSI